MTKRSSNLTVAFDSTAFKKRGAAGWIGNASIIVESSLAEMFAQKIITENIYQWIWGACEGMFNCVFPPDEMEPGQLFDIDPRGALEHFTEAVTLVTQHKLPAPFIVEITSYLASIALYSAGEFRRATMQAKICSIANEEGRTDGQ